MAIEVNYRQAVRLFLSHLQENNMTQEWLESFSQTLQGSFKRFIGNELKLYPLSLDKVRDRYSKPRQYSFACSVKKFHFFIKNNPYLVKASFGQAIAELIEHLSELSTHTKRYRSYRIALTIMLKFLREANISITDNTGTKFFDSS